MERRKIILDVDTGSDDAIAIATALLSPELDVLGICTVGGNVEVKNTTDNTLRVVECCGAQDRVKVYRGAALPLASTLQPAIVWQKGLFLKARIFFWISSILLNKSICSSRLLATFCKSLIFSSIL